MFKVKIGYYNKGFWVEGWVLGIIRNICSHHYISIGRNEVDGF